MPTMNLLSKTIATLALLGAAAAQATPQLVANGSFEQGTGGIGSFAGWTAVLGDDGTFVDSRDGHGTHFGQASDGLWAAYFGSTAADGGATISQSLATTPGQHYTLSFDVANDNGGLDPSNALVVSVAGVQVFDAEDLATQDYVHETIGFTATSSTTLLSLYAFNDASWVEIDNVGATASSVPEPGQAPMLVAGLLLATASIARRRRGRR
jgi:hypothetical protein